MQHFSLFATQQTPPKSVHLLHAPFTTLPDWCNHPFPNNPTAPTHASLVLQPPVCPPVSMTRCQQSTPTGSAVCCRQPYYIPAALAKRRSGKALI